jgi:hypothetical protein
MIGNTEAYVRRLAATLGIDPSNAEVQKLSRQAMQDSWTTSGTPNEYADSTIIQSLVNHANVYRQAGAPAGDVATLSDYLQTLSSHYMLGLDRSAIDALIQKVMKKDTGESNFTTGAEATLKQELQQQAIARYGKTYPGIANAISQGDTTAQFLQNYRNTTATIQTITASTGMTLTPAQVRTLALQLTNQNAANAALTGESTLNRDTITTAVANIWGAEPAQEQAGTTAAGATPTPKGDVAILEDSLSKLAGQYTYPMSQQQLTTMVDQYMKGDNGSPDFLSGAQAYFENWLKDWATNHYKNLGPGVMAAAIAKGETPAQFMNVLAATQSEAYKTAASLGIKLSGNDLYNIALQVTKKNAENGETGTDAAITDPEITRGITALANIKKQGVNTGGDVSTLADSYQKIAGQYLQAMTPAQLDTYLQNSMGTDVGQGNFTTGATSAFEQQMKNAAIAKYPYMKEQIAEGTTPAQFIAPYATAASNLLEIAPTVAQSELANGKLSFALEQKDPKTGAPTPMSIADFKQELMSNPQYGYQFTDQAVKSAYTIGAELARSLGVISGGVA